VDAHNPKKISGKHRDWLLEQTKARVFILRGLVAELAEGGLKVDYRSVWEFVQAKNLNFKKSLVASESDRPDVARRRRGQLIAVRPGSMVSPR
jgi:transposase